MVLRAPCLAALLASCQATPAPPPSPLVQRMNALADQACACSNVSCTEDASRAIMEVLGQLAQRRGAPPSSPAEVKAVQDAAGRAALCKARVRQSAAH